MSRFTLTIATDNAAFDPNEGGDVSGEVARILREVADKVESGRLEGVLRDINGANVGQYHHSEDEDQED